MTKQEMHLDSAQAFFAALRAPDPVQRLSVLKAIRQGPQLALGFGAWQGMDVIDELIQQAYAKHGFIYWMALIATLAVFDDPRVVAHFKKLLNTWDNPEVLAVVTARLAREPLDDLRPSLKMLLRQMVDTNRRTAAADLLLRDASLPGAERVMATVANSQGADIAGPCDALTMPTWLGELAGPGAMRARELLAQRGELAYQALLARWAVLPDSERIWLLRWGVSTHPQAVEQALQHALVPTNSDKVLVEALAAARSLDSTGERFNALVSPLAMHTSATVRLAAVRAGARGVNWRLALQASQDGAFCAAVAERLAQAEGTAALPDLVALLHHPDWAARAGAATALTGLGPQALAPVRTALPQLPQEARAAATSVLMQLGDVEWLENHLIPN